MTRETSNLTNTISNSTVALERVVNKGPLLTIAIALFGEESFISSRVSRPEAYLHREGANDIKCIELAPCQGLLRDQDGNADTRNRISDCISNDAFNIDDLQYQLATFVISLYSNGERIKNAFEAAAFLANEAWLLDNSISRSFSVHYDMGADSEVPVISIGGVIAVSILLVLYLSSLLAMAIYSARTPRWTKELDAFAMMRIGAFMADRLPLRVGHGADELEELDEMPGWIGDSKEGEGPAGGLALGAPQTLMRDRQYSSYRRLDND